MLPLFTILVVLWFGELSSAIVYSESRNRKGSEKGFNFQWYSKLSLVLHVQVDHSKVELNFITPENSYCHKVVYTRVVLPSRSNEIHYDGRSSSMELARVIWYSLWLSFLSAITSCRWPCTSTTICEPNVKPHTHATTHNTHAAHKGKKTVQ